MATRPESAETPHVPSRDEVLEALGTIVPTMEHVTVNLAAKALATRFNVRMEDIKLCYHGLVFRFLHQHSARESVTDSGSSDGPGVPAARLPLAAVPKIHQPANSASSAVGSPNDGEDVEWEIEVAPDAHDDFTQRKKHNTKPRATAKEAVKQKRPVKDAISSSSSSSSSPKSPALKRPRLQTSATRVVVDQRKVPPPTTLETSPAARLQRQREAKPQTSHKVIHKNQREKKGVDKLKRGLQNLMDMAKAIGIYRPNSTLSRCVKQAPSDATKCTLLQKALNAHGQHFERMYPTRAEISRAKAAFETQRELDGIEASNILKEGTHRRHAVVYQQNGLDADSSGSDAAGRYGHMDADGEEKDQSSDEPEPSDDSLE